MYHHILKCKHPDTGFVSVNLSTCLLPQPPAMLQLHSKLQGVVPTTGKRLLRLFERVMAGGSLDMELIGAVIDRLFQETLSSNIQIASTVSTVEAFLTDSDTCPICLDHFTEPIQTECRHVFCILCMRALCDIRARCPLCRHEFGSGTITVWPLRVVDSKATFMALLTGPGTTLLNEKIVAFDHYLQVHGQRGPLVLFSKRICTATAYIEVCKQHGKQVIVAGLNVGRKQSCANIELFRQGAADVLFCDYTYSAGFDLCNAAHLVVLDVDLRLANIIQSIGRLTRIGQVFSTVYVTILLYEHGFDHFLFNIRQTLGKSFENTITNLFQLEQFCTQKIQGTRMFRLEQFIHSKIVPWLETVATTVTTKTQFTLIRTPSKRSRQMLYKDTYSYPKVHFWRVTIENGVDVTISCSRKHGIYALHTIEEIPCEALWGR